MSRLAVLFMCAVVSLTVLSGCGAAADPDQPTQASAEGSTSTPDPSEPAEPEFDPTTATLTGAPFCSELDVAAAEELLGLGSGQLELSSERRVGEKFASPLGGSTKSTRNACLYADSGGVAFLNVSVGPDSSAQEVADALERSAEYVGAEGQSDKCAVEKVASYGDPGGVVLCTGVSPSVKGRAQVSVQGLVGSSSYFCQAGLVKGSSPQELEQPTRDFCADVLQQLSVG